MTAKEFLIDARNSYRRSESFSVTDAIDEAYEQNKHRPLAGYAYDYASEAILQVAHADNLLLKEWEECISREEALAAFETAINTVEFIEDAK